MIPARRGFIAAMGLGLVAPRVLAAAVVQPPKLLRFVQRWTTGNSRLAPPTVIGQRVLCAGDRTLGLFEVGAETPIWSIPHRLAEGAVFRPRLAADVVVCGGRREIGAWRVATEEPLWRYQARVQIGVPCVSGDSIFFGDGHELVALKLDSGVPRWRFATTADTLISYAPVATDTTVYVGPGDGRLYALSILDGRLLWAQNRVNTWQYLRQLHISDHILVAGSYKEKLYGIDIDNGDLLWEFSAGNFINSHHVSKGVAYLWSPTGWLYAVDTKSGGVRWRHRTTDYRGEQHNWGSLIAELATFDDRLYALDLHNVVHVLRTVDGAEVESYASTESLKAFVQPVAKAGVLLGAPSGDLLLALLE